MMTHMNTYKDQPTITNAVCRDESSGLCEVSEVLVDGKGTPITDYGYEFKLTGTTELSGWGRYDGPVDVWTHISGAYSVLLERVGMTNEGGAR
jgi:hypothetical protein